MFHVTKSSTTTDRQITITIYVLLLMEILMNNVDHVFFFCFFFYFLFSLIFSIPPHIFFLYVSYIVQNPYHINDTAWISCCFCHNPCIFWLSVSCMYLTYFLIMHCIYLFIFSLELRCYVYLFISCLLTYLVFSYVI